jgi:hypothetical protein
MDSIQQFQQFFEYCVGNWATERTYHYLTHQEIERSQTVFTIKPIPLDVKGNVLSDNQYPPQADLGTLPGFHLAFEPFQKKGRRFPRH